MIMKSVCFKNPVLFIIISLFLIIASAGCKGNETAGNINDPVSRQIEVRVNPPEEFDFLKKSEIYEIRKKSVNAYPLLLKAFYTGEYKPLEEIFGQIEDGKSWWGTLGIYHYGPGLKSIEGPSEESRFICNPFIPVALCERWARGIRDPQLKPEAIFPEPVTVVWDIPGKKVTVKYNVENYLKKSEEVGDKRAGELKLIAYNAKDLGYGYFHIYRGQTENVDINPQSEALLIPQFLHTGNDSGYPGGSNNMSPGFPPLNIKLNSLPARLTVGLWKKKPSDLKSVPDITEVLEME